MNNPLNIRRYPGNPVLGPQPELPWGGHEARNPGVIFDGQLFHMVFTATSEPDNGEIYLGHAVSKDGMHFTSDPQPLMAPDPNPDTFDHANVEDARVTWMDGHYYIAYAGRSFNLKEFAKGKRRLGPNGNVNPTWTENFRRGGFAFTDDWKSCARLGPCTSEHVHDANIALFPEKFGGKYAILHRPTCYVPWLLPSFYHPASIWLAFNKTLGPLSSNRREMPWNMREGEDWPDDHLLIAPRYDWENFKVGASGVPIPTDDGWLMFYHAVDRAGVYRVGLLLLDREDPLKVIARSPRPIMEPEGALEKHPVADAARLHCYPFCVFPCANPLIGDEIWLYYGASDLFSCLATLNLKTAMDYITSPECRSQGGRP